MANPALSQLGDEFDRLHSALVRLLALFDEVDDGFWSNYLQRGLTQVAEHKLGGATYVLGCFGGIDTLSDYTIGYQYRESDPTRYRNLNARLGELRTEVFASANAIAARRSW